MNVEELRNVLACNNWGENIALFEMENILAEYDAMRSYIIELQARISKLERLDVENWRKAMRSERNEICWRCGLYVNNLQGEYTERRDQHVDVDFCIRMLKNQIGAQASRARASEQELKRIRKLLKEALGGQLDDE